MSPVFTFTDGQAIVGTISNILDVAGNSTTFKSPPAWLSSDSSIFAPMVASDGLSCMGTMLKTGTVTIAVTGDGVVETVTINAVAGVVASFSISFAPAPPAPPPTA